MHLSRASIQLLRHFQLPARFVCPSEVGQDLGQLLVGGRTRLVANQLAIDGGGFLEPLLLYQDCPERIAGGRVLRIHFDRGPQTGDCFVVSILLPQYESESGIGLRIGVGLQGLSQVAFGLGELAASRQRRAQVVMRRSRLGAQFDGKRGQVYFLDACWACMNSK